jgi:predicted enzyme related to lactoylglutathione lyase
MLWDLNAKDAPRAKQFYGELFGWEIGPASNDRVKLSTVACGEEGINGVIGQAPSAGDDDLGIRHIGVIIYIKVDDVQSYLDKVAQLGGKAIWGPMDVGNGHIIAQFEDLEGNRMGLSN